MTPELVPQEAALEIRGDALMLTRRNGSPWRAFLQACAAWAAHTDTPADAMANRCCEP
jgi:hypothetical protein